MELLKMMGERLKALRENNHLTQKDMADLLDCTSSHYQKIEYLLAERFGVSTDYLLGRTDNREINR